MPTWRVDQPCRGKNAPAAARPHGRVVVAAAIRRAYLWYEVLALGKPGGGGENPRINGAESVPE